MNAFVEAPRAHNQEEDPTPRVLADGRGRRIDYARLSVTAGCNLSCCYCRRGAPASRNRDELAASSLARLAESLALCGITRIRITGGEPLLRPDLPEIIRSIRALDGIRDISMTTNGLLLREAAPGLRRAGLDRVNVSLDTLSPGRFKEITGSGRWSNVWQGIQAALEAGLSPVKVNVVLMSGVNDDEVDAFIDLAARVPLHIRFIETMPMGPEAFRAARALVPSDLIQQRLERTGFHPCRGEEGSGPARVFVREGGPGTVGLISAVTRPFCDRCNRIRVTASGRLLLCLESDVGLDLRPFLADDMPPEAAADAVARAVRGKPEGHRFDTHERSPRAYAIWETGG